MVVRNEEKFMTRNKSKRNFIENAVIRPEIVAMMEQARTRLAFHEDCAPWIDLTSMKEVDHRTVTSISASWDRHWKEYDLSTLFLEKDVMEIYAN